MLRKLAIHAGLLVVFAAAMMSASIAKADNSDNYDFRFGPVSLIFGFINADFDIAIAPDWTIGPTLEYWHPDSDISKSVIGARANWFKNGVFTDGLYLGPSIKYEAWRENTSFIDGQNVTGTASGIAIGCLIGYGWFWDSFNMMLGVGADVGITGQNQVTVTDSNGYTATDTTTLTSLDGEFTLGWKF